MFNLFKLIKTIIVPFILVFGIVCIISSCGGGGGGGGGGGDGSETRVDPLILSLTTEIGDESLTNILMPKQKSIIWTSGLKDENLTVEIEVNESIIPITPQVISIEDNTLSFIAPEHLSDGYLRLKGTDFITPDIAFDAMNSMEPYITSIDPVIATSGQLIEIKGANLSGISADVVFQGKTDEITKEVTPVDDTFSLIVPDEAVSGLVYMRLNQYETNRLALTIKRGIDVNVSLEQGVSFEPSKISFILGLNEITLDANFEASLNVEKNDLQYLHAIVTLNDDTASLLYSAAVLPDMQDVTVDAKSTAIAMVLMGMSTGVVSQPDSWRSVYDAVASNGKVGAFADYIALLQNENFSTWKNLDDTMLMQKYQEALEDVISSDATEVSAGSLFNQNINAQSASSNTVIIKQKPENNNIFVNDTVYVGEVPTSTNLNNGSVNIINDTRLFLSFEARSKKDNTIIGGYRHLKTGLHSKPTSIGPKGWAFLGLSSIKNVQLNGKDANLQIVIGGYDGNSDHDKLADELRVRVYLEGVFFPTMNSLFSTLFGQHIKQTYGDAKPLARRIQEAMVLMYGTNFIGALGEKIAAKEFTNIPREFIVDPFLQGMESCAKGEALIFNSKCETMAYAVAILLNLDPKKAAKELLEKIAIARFKQAVKNSSVLVPVYGWVIRGAFFVYDNSGYVADTITIAESFADMDWNPKQIDADIDFPLEITDVNPMCIGVTPSTNLVTLSLKGEGFPESGNVEPPAKIGDGVREVKSSEYFTNVAGTQMTVKFDGQELIRKSGGSRVDNLYMALGDNFNWQYDKPITTIDQNDDVVYFDSINPSIASPGQTVTLKGCGWIPLNDITVWFESQDGFVEAQILERSVDAIDVIVPKNAISGAVWVTSGNKDTRELHITITRECSKYESEVDQQCKINCISGSFLGQNVAGDFAVKIKHDGSIVGIFENENADAEGSISGRVIGDQVQMNFGGDKWNDILLKGSLDGSGGNLTTSGQVHRTDIPTGHGNWSAEVVSQNSLCDKLDSSLIKVDYVVWYMDNVRCWDAPRVYATDRAGFDLVQDTCDIPGGGRNCDIKVEKVPLQEGFNTIEEAQAWFCPQITTEWFHYWCNNRGSRVEVSGGDLYTLQIPCDLTDVPYKYP